MNEGHHRSCNCGAVYSRTEAMAPNRQIASFECAVCGATMESWNTAWVPTYRLIVGVGEVTQARESAPESLSFG
jgi:hypothetical protein